MDPGAQVGVAAAVSALGVTVKTISVIANEVKGNTIAIRQLSALCTDKQHELYQVLTETTPAAAASNRAKLIGEYVIKFGSMLKRIEKDMKSWAGYDFWQRIQSRRVVAAALAEHFKNIVDGDRSLKLALATFTFTTTQEALQAHRQNSDKLDTIAAFLQSQAQKQTAEFSMGQISDAHEANEHIFSTARTVENLDNSMLIDLPPSEQGYQNLNAQHEIILASLQSDDDPVTRESREKLAKALTVRGNLPLFTVDPVDLTVPIRVYEGGHATICQGLRDGQKVAIKQLKFEMTNPDAVFKRINRESKIWRQLEHKNIVPFIGISAQRNQIPMMISRWMPNDNARTYVRRMGEQAEMDDDAPEPDCIKIFLDIADGLVYLHSRTPPVLHGGLKASNILIDEDGTARITDFTLSSIEAEVQSGSRPPPMRWSAPEILDGEDITFSADMYSFACVMLEIITDQDPFFGYNHLFYLHRKIREGQRPEFPNNHEAYRRGLTSTDCKLWRLMQSCWAARPEARPTAIKARDILEKIWDSRGRHA